MAGGAGLDGDLISGREAPSGEVHGYVDNNSKAASVLEQVWSLKQVMKHAYALDALTSCHCAGNIERQCAV